MEAQKKQSAVDYIKSKIPKYSLMSLPEQADYRLKFQTKFILLQEAWKTYNIPVITDEMSLEEIHECYELFVKNIRVSENSGRYKIYLVIMWLFIEYACCRIGLNISGYTMYQLKAMNKYETLLIKLGEKHYVYTANEHHDYPVEYDIIFLALTNAIAFILIKTICSYMNVNNEELVNTMMEEISTFLSGENPQPGNLLFQTAHQSNNQGGGGLGAGQPNMGDVSNIVASLGSMFLNRTMNAPKSPVVNDQQTRTPKYKPVYDD